MHRATDAPTLLKTAVLVNNYSWYRRCGVRETRVLLLRLLALQKGPYLEATAPSIPYLASLDRRASSAVTPVGSTDIKPGDQPFMRAPVGSNGQRSETLALSRVPARSTSNWPPSSHAASIAAPSPRRT